MDIVLLPEAVACACADTQPQVLERLAGLFARAYDLDETEVAQRLADREALGSTGFGRGIAIPHCRIASVRHPTMALLKLGRPVDFRAADAMPITLAIGLVSPEEGGMAHLHALAAISRFTRDEAMLSLLCEAPDADALFAIFDNHLLRDAA
ncbi:MAG: PTS sugar transporter subunit IIA [Erythrobacter sp.]